MKENSCKSFIDFIPAGSVYYSYKFLQQSVKKKLQETINCGLIKDTIAKGFVQYSCKALDGFYIIII